MKKAGNLDPSVTSGRNKTYWIDSVGKSLNYEKLSKNLETDVVIIGGGMAGVSIAYCLAKTGKQVVLVEDGHIASGETGRTSAHLASALDDGMSDLEKMYGEEMFKKICQSQRAAVDFIEKTVKEEKIDCEFKRVKGYLFLNPNDPYTSLKEEMEAAKRGGFQVQLLEKVPGIKMNVGSCLEFADQGQFHPLKYLSGLCEAIIENGGQIYTDTHAKEISSEGIISREGYKVNAMHVVVATNSPVNNLFAIHLKQYAFRTYIIGSLVKKGTLPQALWWDSGDYYVNLSLPPYHYIRIESYDEQHDLLITGGEDHPVALGDHEHVPEEHRFDRIEEWARAHFEIEKVIYKWSGQILEPMDSLAFIGRNPLDSSNVYVATGDSGNGLTHATIAGILICDLINEKENEWEEIYDPSRFRIFKAGRTFLKENIGNMMEYFQTKPDDTDPEKIKSLPFDEGTIVKIDGKHYGIYKDSNGVMHKVSAACTHLRCIVKWNNAEKSWDCPCHGSRYTFDGKVINGPTNKDLPYEILKHIPRE